MTAPAQEPRAARPDRLKQRDTATRFTLRRQPIPRLSPRVVDNRRFASERLLDVAGERAVHLNDMLLVQHSRSSSVTLGSVEALGTAECWLSGE
jgi:hypothetical protein